VINVWEFTTLFFACCLVSATVGWVSARLAYLDLAHRVASMEAAVAAYWDRIRKRMRVEQAPVVSSPENMTDAEILEFGRKHGLVMSHERE
jgi:hypothetical protein